MQNMRKNGNIAVNKVYNPKNKQPDIPVDADEVDSAMERFIRKKYQEKSLAEGKPQPPSHGGHELGMTVSRSPESSPPPLPPKKSRFFGFGLRASSSTYPHSKHDKKQLPREPRVDSAFVISSDEYGRPSGSQRRPSAMDEQELQKKAVQLREMGFTDTDRNLAVLMSFNGNLERAMDSLLKTSKAQENQPKGVVSTPTSRAQASTVPSQTTSSSAAATTISNNPFEQVSSSQSFGISIASPPPQQALGPSPRSFSSNNPFERLNQSATNLGLEQGFQNLQISQPLFPHSTGGYPSQVQPVQDPRLQYSMTPPVPSVPSQYAFVASPASMTANTNPFLQTSQVAQPVATNSFGAPNEGLSPTASTNPFFNPATGTMDTLPSQSLTMSTNFNPFGIPPTPPRSAPLQTSPPAMTSPFQAPATSQFSQPPSHFTKATATSLGPNSPPFHSSYTFPNPQYTQMVPETPQIQPYQSSNLLAFSQQQQQQSMEVPSRPLLSQQIGRIDKSSILALYNYPHLAPQLVQPLPSIPEPSEPTIGQQPQATSTAAVAISQGGISHPTRSFTMPVGLYSATDRSSMHNNSRNPFLSSTSPGVSGGSPRSNLNPMFVAGAAPGQPTGTGARHASAESVSINNLDSGRHSPDAFANLSARYVS